MTNGKEVQRWRHWLGVTRRLRDDFGGYTKTTLRGNLRSASEHPTARKLDAMYAALRKSPHHPED